MDLKTDVFDAVLLRICTSTLRCVEEKHKRLKRYKNSLYWRSADSFKRIWAKMFKITLRPTNTYLWIVKQTLQNEKSIFTSSRKLSRWFICSFIEERLRLTWSFKACSSVLKDSSCLALWKKNQFDYYLGYNFLKMKIIPSPSFVN